jgi:hypothetical protein
VESKKKKVIPVIIEKNGTISKKHTQYPSNISGKHENQEVQTNSHIGHRTHTKETYFKTYFTGEITLHVADILNTEQ